jgi:hypothetical protein
MPDRGREGINALSGHHRTGKKSPVAPVVPFIIPDDPRANRPGHPPD